MRLQNLLLILAAKNTCMLYILRLFHISHASYEPSTITESQTRFLNTKKNLQRIYKSFRCIPIFQIFLGGSVQELVSEVLWAVAQVRAPKSTASPRGNSARKTRKMRGPKKPKEIIKLCEYPMTDSHGTCVYLPT